MKNKQVVINFITNVAAFVVNAGFTFFITPYIVGKVGSEAYGFVPLAFSMSNYVAVFTAALNSMAARYISIEINRENNEMANVYFNSVLKANTIIAILLILPSVVATLYIDSIFNVPETLSSDVRLTFGFAFINIIISLVGNIFAVATFTRNRVDLSSYRTLESNILKLGATLLLFALFKPNIYFFTLTTIVATLYVIIANIRYTKKLLPQIKISIKNSNIEAVKTLIKSGIWNSINSLSSLLSNGIDIAIANIFINAASAGQYSIAKTVPTFMFLFVSSVGTVFSPHLTILFAKKMQKELVDFLSLSMKAMNIFVGIPISFLMVFGDKFFMLWMPGEDTGTLFLLLRLTLVPMIVAVITDSIYIVYTVTNKLKIPSILLFVTSILKTGIVFILLQTTTLGILTIPIVSIIIGLSKNLFFTPLYAAQCLNIKRYALYLPVLRGTILSIVSMLLCFTIKNIFNIGSWVTLFTAVIICGILSLVVGLFIVLNKNERREVFSFIKSILLKNYK